MTIFLKIIQDVFLPWYPAAKERGAIQQQAEKLVGFSRVKSTSVESALHVY